MPHSDLDLKFVDDVVFQNIMWYGLHLDTTRAPIFPYIEVVECIINLTKCRNYLINNKEVECIITFLP